MSPRPNKPFYSQAPIPDLDALARVVRLSRESLLRLAEKADGMYEPVTLYKKDGTPRRAWSALRKLKRVHAYIKTRILDHIEFPTYLQGGIRDKKNPRDYARNAAIHAGQAVVIAEDVADFFPSISAELVGRIWRELFRFPPDVADCLVKLTTRRGEVPQGAKTSNHLANLAFFDDEHQLEERFRSCGLRYSRLTDDITISSHGPLSVAAKREAISAVYAMMHRGHFKPKRKKHGIFVQSQAMRVHSLVVNRHAALPRTERDTIRAEVHHLAAWYCGTDELLSHPARVLGRLGKLKRFHPAMARRLREKVIR
jgi:hypothetical protein